MRIVLLVVFAVVALACSPGEPAAPITTTSTTQDLSSIDLSDYEPESLVLRVTYAASMAVEEAASRLPPYSLYADGKLLVPGSMPAASALRPILQPVDEAVLGETDMNRALVLIEAIGLVANERGGDSIQGPGGGTVVDGSTTIATFTHSDGSSSKYSVYALHSFDGSQSLSGATAALVELLAVFDDYMATTQNAGQYEPERVQVMAAGPSDTTSLTLPWPLPVDPRQFEVDGRFDIPCHVLEGDDAGAAIEALAAAKQATVWKVGDVVLWIRGRILLPGEAGCGVLPLTFGEGT